MRVARIGVFVAGASALVVGLCEACVGDNSPAVVPVPQDGGTVDSGVGTMPIDSGGSTDAGNTSVDSAAPCNTLPWILPGLVTGVDTPSNELSATLTADVLTMFLTRAGGGGVAVYQATRDAGGDFGTPVAVTDIATSYFGGMVPSITGDGLTVYLAYKSFPDGGVDLFPPEGGVDAGASYFDLYRYTRATVNDPFVGPQHVDELASALNDMQPAISSDGNTIIFASDRDSDGGPLHLYQATKSGATFGAPTPITGLFTDSTVATTYPAVNATLTELYFSASPSGGPGDIYLSTRGSASGSFGPATAVSPVNSGFDDRPAWISPDECRMYLVSNNKGDYNIYLSRKR